MRTLLPSYCASHVSVGIKQCGQRHSQLVAVAKVFGQRVAVKATAEGGGDGSSSGEPVEEKSVRCCDSISTTGTHQKSQVKAIQTVWEAIEKRKLSRAWKKPAPVV